MIYLFICVEATIDIGFAFFVATENAKLMSMEATMSEIVMKYLTIIVCWIYYLFKYIKIRK